MKSFLKSHPLVKIVISSVYDLPSPAAVNHMWNFGSLLGLCLGIQLITGLFLAFHFTGRVETAFESVSHIARDVNGGWWVRMLHANGARVFFICLYIHLIRGLYFGSFTNKNTWMVGVLILLLVMASAFLGYVLPWGQMSFWGATVITNLFSAIPYIGEDLVNWIWGGFAVDNATLTRFFAFHFIAPFAVLALVLVHLLFLHQTGSRNVLGLSFHADKIPFHPYFSFKDTIGFIVMISCFAFLVIEHPWALGDPENFIPANPLVTPVHIQPEWYFLFAYAILRSIPNKLGGVIALAISVLFFFILPFFPSLKFQAITLYPARKFLFWRFCGIWLLLSWIGARPVEAPYVLVGQVLTLLYFTYFFMAPALARTWDSLLVYHKKQLIYNA